MEPCRFCHTPCENPYGYCSMECYVAQQDAWLNLSIDDLNDSFDFDDEIICLACGPELCEQCKKARDNFRNEPPF